ncbi:hypothetical protein H6F89_26485 [Cyanobacteria bacterium FACHB-63]|nr:hypothetical protein [Cyanobacteria bacterium FACHB-63]
MFNKGSKKFHITLPFDQGSEIETIATQRGVPAAQIFENALVHGSPQLLH